MIGYFEVSEHNRSMARLLAFIAVVAGSVVVLVSTACFVYLTCAAPIERAPYVPQAIAFGAIGAGMVTGGEILKNAQKKREV